MQVTLLNEILTLHLDDSAILYRTLGYLGPAYAIKNAHFGQGKGPIWLDGIQCLGNETNVDQCMHEDWGNHNCKHDEDISLSCSTLGARMVCY